jgi:hypothetical protein
MKHLLLAATALGLAGTIGTANAAPVSVPLIASDLGIWNALTPSPNNNINGAPQQALPGTRDLLTLITPTANGAAAGPIDFNYQAVNNGGSLDNGTVGGFLAANPTGPFTSTCTGSCLTTNISGVQGSFTQASLFEFSFTAPSNGTLVVTHDDGVSLFKDLGGGNNPDLGAGCTYNGTAGNATCPTDIFNVADSGPTTSMMTETVNLTGGQLYDLFFTAANGLPEVLHTDFVPAPLIGHGLLVLLAVGGVLFGGKLSESLKTRHSHAA